MANETFGISVIEAQASGLPVVGVAAGAMVDRVTDGIGRIGPVDDAEAMARNLVEMWRGDMRGDGRGVVAPCPAVQLAREHGGVVRRAFIRARWRAAARRGAGAGRRRARWSRA